MKSTVVEIMHTEVGPFWKADPFDPDLEDGIGWYASWWSLRPSPLDMMSSCRVAGAPRCCAGVPGGAVVLLIPGERVPELDVGAILTAGETDGSEA